MEIWNLLFFISSFFFVGAAYILFSGRVPHWMQENSKPVDITKDSNPRSFWRHFLAFFLLGALFVFFGIRLF